MAFALLELFNPWVDNSGTEGYEKKSKDGLAPSQILIGNLTHTESNYLKQIITYIFGRLAYSLDTAEQKENSLYPQAGLCNTAPFRCSTDHSSEAGRFLP